jgi:hypothetical protein
MTENEFRRMVLALEGATEGAHMGHADFRAHGRIFASLPDRQFGMVALTPEQQQLVMNGSRAFTPASGAWGRSGYTRVELRAADGDMVGEALTLAWQNAAAKAKARRTTSSAKSRGVKKGSR